MLAAVLISAINAIVRKAFDMSSNAFLEIQWYLFSAVFLLCSAWTLLRNEHIRIDVIAGRYSRRTQTWIDVFGTLFFLFPMVALVLYESWPWALARGREQGDLGQRRRPHPLAGQGPRAHRLRPAAGCRASRN